MFLSFFYHVKGYYQKKGNASKIGLVKDIKTFLKKNNTKGVNMLMNNIEIFL